MWRSDDHSPKEATLCLRPGYHLLVRGVRQRTGEEDPSVAEPHSEHIDGRVTADQGQNSVRRVDYMYRDSAAAYLKSVRPLYG